MSIAYAADINIRFVWNVRSGIAPSKALKSGVEDRVPAWMLKLFKYCFVLWAVTIGYLYHGDPCGDVIAALVNTLVSNAVIVGIDEKLKTSFDGDAAADGTAPIKQTPFV